MESNIYHEMVRRKRWNLLHRGYPDQPDFFYKKDINGISPYESMLEKASFDVIETLNVTYGITELQI